MFRLLCRCRLRRQRRILRRGAEFRPRLSMAEEEPIFQCPHDHIQRLLVARHPAGAPARCSGVLDVQASPQVYADETGRRTGGKNGHLWGLPDLLNGPVTFGRYRGMMRPIRRYILVVIAGVSLLIDVATLGAWAASHRFGHARLSWGSDWYLREGLPGLWADTGFFAAMNWKDRRGTEYRLELANGALIGFIIAGRQLATVDDAEVRPPAEAILARQSSWSHLGVAVQRSVYDGSESAKVAIWSVQLYCVALAASALPGLMTVCLLRARTLRRVTRFHGFPVGCSPPGGRIEAKSS
jgi:hypothetical protein